MMHQGDVGTVIRLTTGIDLSSAVSAQIRYRKPSGVTGIWNAVINGESLQYVTQMGDIDESGEWGLQGVVDLSVWQGSTLVVVSTVGGVLA